MYRTDLLTSCKVTDNTSLLTQEVWEDVVLFLDDKIALGTAIALLQTSLDALVAATDVQ